VFGSCADRSFDSKSDLDVMLCGVTREQLSEPYFADILGKLKGFSVEEGNALDLFLDVPGEHRLESVFSPGERAVAPGPENYARIKAASKPMMPQTVFQAAIQMTQRGREPITSEDEFVERQMNKLTKLQSLPLPAGYGAPTRDGRSLEAASR
jgi:hypothetical protein